MSDYIEHTNDDHLLIQPLAILNTRHTPNSKLEVLVQWQGLSSNDTTWEDWHQLQTDYHLDDKVLLEGMRNDSNTRKPETTTRRESRALAYLKDFI
ncbi:hypothetical protein HKD37_13G035835 [Glycine soja]